MFSRIYLLILKICILWSINFHYYKLNAELILRCRLTPWIKSTIRESNMFSNNDETSI